MSPTPLLDWVPPVPKGTTFQAERDGPRLCRQALAIFAIMKDQQSRTLGQLEDMTGYPQASISARLRDIRRTGLTVERKHLGDGLHSYTVKV